jgi:hypothetical protein
MKPEFLYHYTDAAAASEIRRRRVILAKSQILHKDMFGKDRGFPAPPVVWLTINPILDGTVVSKLVLAGHKRLEGELHRVVLPGDYCDVGLGDFTEARGIDPEWWVWVVKTGEMAGSNYTTWRVVDHDVKEKDWLRVEVMTGLGPDGTTTWEEI